MQRENNRSDEALAALAQQGDRTAQEELLGRYQNLVRYCARKFFLSGGETDDLVQEGMMGLFQAIGAYKATENGCSFKNFAYLCMKRRIIDEVKRSKKLQNIVFLDSLETLTEQKDLDAGMIFLDEQKELLQKISGVLSDLEFRVFTLYLNGMSSGEICDLTGKSAKSVDNALQRSKSKLLKFMEKKEK